MNTSTATAIGPFIPEWTFAEKFRKARKLVGMEQREFAVALDLTPSTVAAYESGRSEPRFRDVGSLAKRIQALSRIDYRWFLETSAPEPSPSGEPTTITDWLLAPNPVIDVDFVARRVVQTAS